MISWGYECGTPTSRMPWICTTAHHFRKFSKFIFRFQHIWFMKVQSQIAYIRLSLCTPKSKFQLQNYPGELEMPLIWSFSSCGHIRLKIFGFTFLNMSEFVVCFNNIRTVKILLNCERNVGVIWGEATHQENPVKKGKQKFLHCLALLATLSRCFLSLVLIILLRVNGHIELNDWLALFCVKWCLILKELAYS